MEWLGFALGVFGGLFVLVFLGYLGDKSEEEELDKYL